MSEIIEFGVCPKCNEGLIVNGTNTFTCSTKDCDLLVFKNFNGANITPEEFEQILEAGEEGIELNSFHTKEEKQYSATIVFNTEAYAFHLKYDDTFLDGAECPACQGRIKVTPKGWFCENTSQDIPVDDRCTVIVWKEIAKKTISEKVAKQLLKGEKSDWLTGFISSKGSDFSARLFLDGDTKFNSKVKFDFAIGKCPACEKGDIGETAKAYSCSEWKQGCKFTVWKFQNNYNATVKDVEDILEKGATGVKNFKSKEGKEYQAKLYFDKNKGEVTQI